MLKQVIDQGIRYVAQGNGSGAALALIDAIEKHNERNPAQSIVFLNYAAVDPDLTNSKCSFWHFRFDANTDMKMEALTAYIKDRPEVKNVFLINQNYSHGQQVSRVAKEHARAEAARHQDRRRRPASARAGARLLALYRQDARRQCGHDHHRQLGAGPRAARARGARRRTQCELLHLLRRCHRHADRDRRGRRKPHPAGLVLAPEHHARLSVREDDAGVQEALQRGVVHGRDLHLADAARRRHQAREVDRSAEGRLCDGRREAHGSAWRDRDARDRPPAAAAAVDRIVDQGRRTRTATTSRRPATRGRPRSRTRPTSRRSRPAAR